MSLTFVQGDTAPDLDAVLVYEGTSTPIDLSPMGTSVRFQMRKSDDRRFTVNATATIVDGAAGKVSYSWAANDLATPGDYEVQWEVTFPDTRIQTTAAVQTIKVRRQ